jgi:FixJ family two-component response regulator
MACKPLICIVEDEAAVRESLRLILELEGYCVEDFEEGIEFWARGRFDDALCIILDLNLPGEDGLQILSRLRANAVATPVLIVTGRADASARREAQRLNALGVFQKPLPVSVLLSAISSIENRP